MSLEKLSSYLDEAAPRVLHFLIMLVVVLIIYWIGTKVIKWLCKLFRMALERKNADVSVIRFLVSCVRVALYFLLIVTLAMQLGLKEATVIALVGSIGVGLGLALQGGMANLAGGILILVLKPFVLGDYIIENSQHEEGTVSRIDMFYTTLVTIDNRKVIIPNGQLTNNSIVNVTAQDYRQLDLRINISYHSSIQRAKELIQSLLLQEQRISDEKETQVFVDELADSSVILGVRGWVRTGEFWAVKWRLQEQIKETFDKNDIEIPYQQLDVHIAGSEEGQ